MPPDLPPSHDPPTAPQAPPSAGSASGYAPKDPPSARTLARVGGELLIIVVGVLIALAVDQWNQARAERAREGAYLDAILVDLRADSGFVYRTFLPALEQKRAALTAIAPVVRGQRPVPEDTVAFLNSVAMGGRLGASNGLTLGTRATYEELVSTGALSLLRNPTLRMELVEYHVLTQVLSDRLLARTADYPGLVHQFYPGEVREGDRSEVVRAFGVKRAVDRVRSEEFESVMNSELNYLYFAEPLMENQGQRVTRLIQAVERYRGTGVFTLERPQ